MKKIKYFSKATFNILICGVAVSFFGGKLSQAVAGDSQDSSSSSQNRQSGGPWDGGYRTVESTESRYKPYFAKIEECGKIDISQKNTSKEKLKQYNQCMMELQAYQRELGSTTCESSKTAYRKASNDFNKECGKASLASGKLSSDSIDASDDSDTTIADSTTQNSSCYAEVLRCQNAPGSYGSALGNANTADGAGAVTGLMQNMLGGGGPSSKYCPTKLGRDVTSERDKAQKNLKDVQDSIAENNKTLDEAKKNFADKQSQATIDINKTKFDLEKAAATNDAENFKIFNEGQQKVQELSLSIKSLNVQEVDLKNQIESSEAAKVAKLQSLMLTCDQKFDSEKIKMDSLAAANKGQTLNDSTVLARNRRVALQKIYDDCKKTVSIQWKIEVANAESTQSSARAKISGIEAQIGTVQDQIAQLRTAVKIQLDTQANLKNIDYKARLQSMNDSLNAVNNESQLLQSMQNRITSENNMKNMQLIMAGQGMMSSPLGANSPSNTSTIADVAAAAETKDESYNEMYQACCIGSFDTLNAKLCSKTTNERIQKVFGNSDSAQ